jgi:hypothetical protein
MKLAEALAERKALKNKMEELKQRIYRNAQAQEGEAPAERPEALIDELRIATTRFALLAARINATNATSTLDGGEGLGEAILRKDMLRYLHQVCTNLADKATPALDRYSRREIRTVAAVDVAALRAQADAQARAYRELDLRVQQTNWQVDLAEGTIAAGP